MEEEEEERGDTVMRASFRQIFVCLEDDAAALKVGPGQPGTSAGRATVMARTFWNPQRGSASSVRLATVIRLDRAVEGATSVTASHVVS